MAPSFDSRRLASFLAATPPVSLTAHADRVLVAHVCAARGIDVADFDVDVATAVDIAVLVAADIDRAAAHVAALAVIAACADVDADVLRAALARVLLFRTAPTLEPFASVERYWCGRAGLAPAPTSRPRAPTADDLPAGVDVDDVPAVLRTLRFATHTHAVFFATDYGARDAVDLDAAVEDARAAAVDVDLDCGDSVASLWLASVCCPAAQLDGAALCARLAVLQDDDGGFRTAQASTVARHHAACVATLAHALRRECDPRENT